MPRYIVKLTDPKDSRDYYLEWSTVVDAPVTYGMSLEEFREYYRDEYGRSAMPDLDQRLARVAAKGTSSFGHESVEELIEGYGWDKEVLLEHYCRRAPREEK